MLKMNRLVRTLTVGSCILPDKQMRKRLYDLCLCVYNMIWFRVSSVQFKKYIYTDVCLTGVLLVLLKNSLDLDRGFTFCRYLSILVQVLR